MRSAAIEASIDWLYKTDETKVVICFIPKFHTHQKRKSFIFKSSIKQEEMIYEIGKYILEEEEKFT